MKWYSLVLFMLGIGLNAYNFIYAVLSLVVHPTEVLIKDAALSGTWFLVLCIGALVQRPLKN